MTRSVGSHQIGGIRGKKYPFQNFTTSEGASKVTSFAIKTFIGVMLSWILANYVMPAAKVDLSAPFRFAISSVVIFGVGAIVQVFKKFQ